MISKQSIELGSKGLLKETLSYLSQYMDKNGHEAEFKKIVIDAIKQHEFSYKNQSNIEAKILYDADKLDALNPIRYRKLIKSVENKKMSKAQLLLLTKIAKIWLKNMRKKYNFEISRKMHDERIKALLKDKEAVQTAKKFGVYIEKLVK